MKLVNQYIIPFKGLKEGEHEFDFQIENAFFEENSSLGIHSGKLTANVLLVKKNNFMELEVSLSGSLSVQCDRCLENFELPIAYSDMLFVKFKDEPEEPDDNVIFLHPNEDMLDLNQYFIDCIGLSLPIQKIHPDTDDGQEGCDPDMLRRIDEHSFKDTNENEIDPRWAKLKNLFNDENKN